MVKIIIIIIIIIIIMIIIIIIIIMIVINLICKAPRQATEAMGVTTPVL